MRYLKSNNNGFTLLEILLAVAALAILAGIVIFAINPGKQLADARNQQRQSDVQAILDAVIQYGVDNDGDLSSLGISATATEICKDGGTCTGLRDLSALTTNDKYLVSIPTDPQGESTNGAGYEISQNTDTDRVTVTAPDTELSPTTSLTSVISVTK